MSDFPLNYRETLKKSILEYECFDATEEKYKSEFLLLLDNPRCYFRENRGAHITVSGWIVNETHTKVLMIFHTKLQRWLQPGGHCDGDENTVEVLKKEIFEETGLQKISIQKQKIWDLDIHTIPERKGVPEHLHYDLRYLAYANEKEPLKPNIESQDIRWVALHEIPKDPSLYRMKLKLTNQ